MLQIVIRSSIVMPSSVLPAVLVRVADAALDAEPADDRQDHVLRIDAGRQAAVDVDAADLQRIEREALRREHVAHLRRADAERDGAERAVRRRVAVAARDRHAGLGEAELRPDDVHDALVRCRLPGAQSSMPNSRQLRSSAVVISSAITSRNGPLLRARSARCDRRSRTCASGYATRQPCWRSMSNACGLVTS